MEIEQDYPDIAVVGSGINKVRHMTLETWDLIQNADYIVSDMNDYVARSFLPEEVDAEWYDYTEFYDPYNKGDRYNAYYESVMTTLELAKENDGLVVYLTVGSPSVASYTTRIMKDLGEKNWGLDVEIYPALSTDVTLYTEVGIDPIDEGVVQLTAKGMLEGARKINPDMNVMLWLVGMIFDYVDKGDFESPIHRLQAYLNRYYSEDKDIYFIRLPKTPIKESTILKTTIGKMHDLERTDINGTTAIIPKSELTIKQEGEAYDISLYDFTDEQKRKIRSGEPREESIYPDLLQNALKEEGKEDLLEVIGKMYKDVGFARAARENPEEVLEEYDLTDAEMKMLTEKTPQLSLGIDGYVNRIEQGDFDEENWREMLTF